MFGGVTHLSVDLKGRILLPSRVKDILKEYQGEDSPLVMTLDSPKCLLIYPQDSWKITQDKIHKMPNASHPLVKSYQRLILGYAEQIMMDKAGRLLLPQALRNMVALGKDVVLVGMGNRLELWSETDWSRETSLALNASAESLSELLGDFSI